MKLLEYKNIWITGASRGIGLAVAKACAASGANLILNARNEQALQVVADQIAVQYDVQVIPLAYDVANQAEVMNAFQFVQKELKQLDVLINNAGVMEDRMLAMATVQHIDEMLGVNVNGALYHMQLAARWMMRKKQGSIINVTSIMGTKGNAGQTVYSTAKAALVGATLSSAKELAPLNIRVNAVSPGMIETDLISKYSKEQIDRTVANIKMKRLGHPDEVAQVMVFLASEMSSYVTGQVIGVDGGMLV